MAFKLVKTGKSYSERGDILPPEQGNIVAGSLPEGYRLKEDTPVPWVLEEWRLVSIPDWRRILGESIEKGDKKREEYARWMLREILEAPECRETP